MRFLLKRTSILLVLLALFGLAMVPRKSAFSSKKISGSTTASEEWCMTQLKNMSLEEKIGQFFMISAHTDLGENELNETLKLVKEQKVGGVIFFQGERSSFQKALKRVKEVASVPLLIGMDAEWGTNMRLFDGERFPYAYTLGAADDTSCTRHIATLMAEECRELGIHINFAPVADVNSDPNNPVIGFRSFGQDEDKVAAHVSAFVKATESKGILSCLKHFPGHGDTDKDSHLELPTVSRSLADLEKVDLMPFQKGIASGAGSVMIAHLNVPALDKSGTPSSLSSIIIKNELIGKMHFEGLVFSDALNMKGVADAYGKDEVAVKAFEAGCDVLLCPQDVSSAIRKIADKVKEGKLSKTEIEQRCLKILRNKYKYVVAPVDYKKSITEAERLWRKQEVFDKAITVLKNEHAALPIKKLDQKILRISIGMHTSFFRDGIELFDDVPYRHYFTLKEAISELKNEKLNADLVIYSLHPTTVRPKNQFGIGVSADELNLLPKGKSTVMVFFGNPLYLASKGSTDGFDAVVVAYENNQFSQNSAAQLLYGALPSSGKLPVSLNTEMPHGYGLQLPWAGRLKFTQPEELEISSVKLSEIDRIAINAIEKGAFPGCQIVVAVKGKIIYRKSFGKPTYESSESVKNTDLYDLASVSKIAGSTLGIMHLQSKGKFSLDKKLQDYLPELTSGSEYGKIVIREMMAHQAGLTPWIPFYKRTLKNSNLDPILYVKEQKEGFTQPVAKELYIRNSYTDSIYEQILQTPLGQKKYEYSDLGYYFIKKILEKESGRLFENYLSEELYAPMGFRTMGYRPLQRFNLKEVIPTEDDQVFRKQLVHGYVHDPGAAMLGGVGGHAGVFSNATDLASLMQLFLNKGSYGGVQYLHSGVVEEYTKAQCPGNRRGAGFDRPSANGGGPCHVAASQLSFGHSGFTGTLVWADPAYGINYVFLSNRVCPDQGNWKIRDMNIRTEIQRVIYEAVRESN
jgi:beta-N-acetylhexosaminidase